MPPSPRLPVSAPYLRSGKAFPERGRPENGSPVGLERGERDTMRLDLRLKGSDHKNINNAVRDQMIGAEQRRIRLERKEKELLRKEEALRSAKHRQTKGTDAGFDKQKREEERIRNKKTKNYRQTLD